MYVDDARRQGLEERQLHGGVVGESTALGRWQYLATEDEEVVVVDICLLEKRLQAKACHIEARLNDTLTLLVGQNSGVGPLAQQQTKGSEENTLTGSRLARDGYKALAKGDVALANQRIVLNM